jgi:hypothetical protein
MHIIELNCVNLSVYNTKCMCYLSCYVMFCSSIHAKDVYDVMYDVMYDMFYVVCILYDAMQML